jgi:long-subunit acyl-CoA synthetase (AMP-forming)
VSHHEQIRRFHLMDRGFTMETNEMTPKLSLRRQLILDNCAPMINRMYTAEATDIRWSDHVLAYVKSLLAK